MNPLIVCMIVGLAGFALAELPVSSGYSYSRPSGGGGGGYSFGGGGGGLSFGGGGGGGYTQVSPGGQTSEGATVDSALLEQIRQILLKEESQAGGGFGGGFGGGVSSRYAAPSSQYGAPPSTQYGVPGGGGYQARVVGIDLEAIRQAMQVAQFNQVTPGGGGIDIKDIVRSQQNTQFNAPSYPSARYPSSSYGAPSRPSSSYGAPF